MDELHSEINYLQQYTNIYNTINTWIPFTKDEIIINILSDIDGILHISFNRYDVSVTHWLLTKSEQEHPPAIVVKSTSRIIKPDWMAVGKANKYFRVSKIHRSFPDNPVYFNEHVTSHTRDIFNAEDNLWRKKIN